MYETEIVSMLEKVFNIHSFYVEHHSSLSPALRVRIRELNKYLVLHFFKFEEHKGLANACFRKLFNISNMLILMLLEVLS